MSAELVALLLVELGLDNGVLNSLAAGLARPRKRGWNAVDLDGALGCHSRIIDRQLEVSLGKIDTLHGTLHAGI